MRVYTSASPWRPWIAPRRASLPRPYMFYSNLYIHIHIYIYICIIVYWLGVNPYLNLYVSVYLSVALAPLESACSFFLASPIYVYRISISISIYIYIYYSILVRGNPYMNLDESIYLSVALAPLDRSACSFFLASPIYIESLYPYPYIYIYICIIVYWLGVNPYLNLYVSVYLSVALAPLESACSFFLASPIYVSRISISISVLYINIVYWLGVNPYMNLYHSIYLSVAFVPLDRSG